MSLSLFFPLHPSRLLARVYSIERGAHITTAHCSLRIYLGLFHVHEGYRRRRRRHTYIQNAAVDQQKKSTHTPPEKSATLFRR